MTTKAPMPKWLTDKLITDGVMTTSRITRNIQTRRCSCGLFTLVALDEILANRTISLDLAPTTAAAEFFALMCGRTTYSLDGIAPFERCARRIAFKSADQEPVYVAHQCGSPMPVNTKFVPAYYKPPFDGPAPF